MLYNDRSVLENHHISTAYRYMEQADSNPFTQLSKDDFRLVLYDSQKQLPHKVKVRLIIIECAGYIFWQSFVRRLYS